MRTLPNTPEPRYSIEGLCRVFSLVAPNEQGCRNRTSRLVQIFTEWKTEECKRVWKKCACIMFRRTSLLGDSKIAPFFLWSSALSSASKLCFFPDIAYADEITSQLGNVMKQQVLLHYYFLICLYLSLISCDHLYIACNPFQYELGKKYVKRLSCM